MNGSRLHSIGCDTVRPTSTNIAAGVVWLAIVFLVAVAIAILIAREPLARMQAMLMGGHMGPGCVVAEAALLLAIAILVFVFRRDF